MENQTNTLDSKLNPRRLIFIGVSSLLMCLSYIMAMFTSFPLSLGAILYGRRNGYIVALITWIVSAIISFGIFNDLSVFILFSLSILMMLFTTEVVLRDINPMKAIAAGGLLIFSLFTFVIMGSFDFSEKKLKESIVSEIELRRDEFKTQLTKGEGSESEESLQVLAMLNEPKKLADDIIKEAPAYMLMSSFLIIWANLFLLLKSRRLFQTKPMKFDDKTLINFKMPDHFIWPVIIGFVFAIWGHEFGEWFVPAGDILLKGLGVFYFFQGFGLYISFLDYVKLYGFFRTLLIVLTVMTAGTYMAVLGLFDMFFNFRKYFKKKEN